MGDWESKIIWDADDLSQIPPPSLLTLDPNDENIIIGMPEDVVKEVDKDLGASADSRGGGGSRRAREKPDRTRTQALIGKVTGIVSHQLHSMQIHSICQITAICK